MVLFRALIVGAWSLGLLGTARAEESPQVLLAGACTPAGASASEILRILDAELSPLHAAPLATADAARTAEAVLGLDGCTDEPPSARISVFRDGERRDRIVALADAAPEARDRVLALALAEALRDPTTTRASDQPPLPWGAPPPAVFLPPQAGPADTGNPATERRARAVAPRAGLVLRYMPASATLALGADAGIDWGRLNAGVRVLATRQGDPLGTATLFAIAGAAAIDAVELVRDVSLRVEGEIGVAVGTGSPTRVAVGRTQAAIHAGLLGGVAGVVPVGVRYELQGFVAGGYATSLDAGADGRRVATLGGGLVSLTLGVGFP